jgi:hypothetical protein
VTPQTEPAIIDVHAGLASVKAALLGVGATSPGQRSVAFTLDDHLLLLDFDEGERCTTIAVGGPRAVETARWLADELDGNGLHVTSVLPQTQPQQAQPPARPAAAAAS